jgi:hypothetical protein
MGFMQVYSKPLRIPPRRRTATIPGSSAMIAGDGRQMVYPESDGEQTGVTFTGLLGMLIKPVQLSDSYLNQSNLFSREQDGNGGLVFSGDISERILDALMHKPSHLPTGETTLLQSQCAQAIGIGPTERIHSAPSVLGQRLFPLA